jgi:hypothetical protein
LVAIAPIFGDAVRAAERREHSNGVFGTLTAPFAIHAVAMIPAALGRADGGHVIYNGTAVFLLALLMPIRPTESAFAKRLLFRGAFFLVFPVLAVALDRALMLPVLKNKAVLQVVSWSERHPSNWLSNGLEKAIGEKEWDRRRVDAAYYQRMSLENQFPALSVYGRICEPLGFQEIFPVLGAHDALQPEYYFSVTDESPAGPVSRKLADLRTCQYVITSGSFLAPMPPLVPTQMHAFRRLLMFPVWDGPIVAPPNRVYFDYLQRWFIPLRQVTPGMFLCARRQDAP